MTTELAPYPFCGCRTPQFEHTGDGRHLAYFVCPRCGAEGEAGKHHDAAQTAWNMRIVFDRDGHKATWPDGKD